MLVNVLLYDAGKDNEGIHSLELDGKTVVLMFEDPDDAQRYSGLLEAQDFPVPTVESLERKEVEEFCVTAGYEACFVQTGFVPMSDKDKLLLVPPELNKDVSSWKENSNNQSSSSTVNKIPNTDALDDIRKRLEDLL